MQIKFSPRRSDTPNTISVTGEVVTVNDVAYDFSGVIDSLARSEAACPWLASAVTRIAGELHLTLILSHGERAPEETRFPAPLSVVVDGPLTLPPFESPFEA